MASTTSNSDVCASNSKPRNLPDDNLIRGFLLSLGTTCLSPANPTTNPRPSPGRACKFVGELPASIRKTTFRSVSLRSGNSANSSLTPTKKHH